MQLNEEQIQKLADLGRKKIVEVLRQIPFPGIGGRLEVMFFFTEGKAGEIELGEVADAPKSDLPRGGYF